MSTFTPSPLPQTCSASPVSAQLDERELVQALLRGDARRTAELYDYLRPAVAGALRRILHRGRGGPGIDFEDLVQSSFERILRGLAKSRFREESSLKTWASAIATHVALDALRVVTRERRRSAPVQDLDELPQSEGSERRLESLNQLRHVQGTLAHMKEKLAEALILHDVLGYTLKEMAALSGASESAVQSRLTRARAEFRRRIASSRRSV